MKGEEHCMPWYTAKISNDGFNRGILDRIQSVRININFKTQIFLLLLIGGICTFLGGFFIYIA
jgi:hypothetical protein